MFCYTYAGHTEGAQKYLLVYSLYILPDLAHRYYIISLLVPFLKNEFSGVSLRSVTAGRGSEPCSGSLMESVGIVVLAFPTETTISAVGTGESHSCFISQNQN